MSYVDIVAYVGTICKQRLLVHFLAAQTQIITQKLYLLQHSLSSSSAAPLEALSLIVCGLYP